jgi:HAD superfamily hydrolase (TIGR01509 family)
MMEPVFIFDYGNVISVVDPSIFIRTVMPYHHGAPIDPLSGFDRTLDLLIRYESGTMDTDPFIHAFLERFDLAMTREEFVRAWSGFLSPIPQTRSMIRTLKRHYTIALLSNTNPLHFEHVIKPTDIFPLFDAVTLSYEAGAMKPALPMYRDSLLKLRAEPTDCIFIDDLLPNIEAARGLGMKGIHFKHPEDLPQQIRSLVPDVRL